MSINIKNALTPKTEDGGLDHRYGKSIKNIIDIAGSQTIQRLEEFYLKSFELEKKYGGDAFNLCLSLFKANIKKSLSGDACTGSCVPLNLFGGQGSDSQYIGDGLWTCLLYTSPSPRDS